MKTPALALLTVLATTAVAAPPELPGTAATEVSPDSIKGYVEKLVSFGTRHTLSDTESDTRGIGAARRWIKSEFERIAASAGRADEIKVYFDSHHVEPNRGRILEPVDIVNVAMEIPGSMPEARARRYYVIGHYDSRNSTANDVEGDAPGADDDASGASVAIELARVLASYKLDSTVVLMPTAGEEQGLYGARGHAEKAVAEGWDIRAVLSNDIVGDPTGPNGRNARDRIRVFSEGIPRNAPAEKMARIRGLSAENDSSSRQLARYIAEVGKAQGLPVQPMLIFRPDRFLRGGDHTPFNEHGFAAVRFTEVYENYNRQHQDVRTEAGVQYGDTPEFVDAGYLADVARLNIATIVSLANAPSQPAKVRIITANLTNDTTIRWDASPEPDVAGYEVLWRETTANNWQGSDDVGNVTEHTIDLSKDNWFFGIRAYDKDGYKSPVVFPAAARQ